MSKTIPFQKVLEALRDEATAFPARYLANFSDLTPQQLTLLNRTWPEIPVERKHDLLKQLVENFNRDYLVSYDDFAMAVLRDPDAEVRAQALRLLLESDDPHLVPVLINLLRHDPDEDVRAEAARLLGIFVYLGELEELDEVLLKEIETALLTAAEDEAHPVIMRKAMEALGFSSRPEVNVLIEAGFKHHDPQWVASALVAMGRSGLMRWEDNIIASLGHDNKEVRLAALGAAGEFGSDDARAILLRQLEEGEDDQEIFRAIIWTLSRIGGEDVRTYLENLLDSEDDDLVEFVEEALENLEFTEELNKFDLLAFDPDDEDLIELDLLEKDEEEEKPKKKSASKKNKKSGK
jgi:HEAT repeat protein